MNVYDRECGKTALFWANEGGHAHILQLLLEHNADLGCLEPTHFLDLLFEHCHPEDQNTETPLQRVYSRTCSCEIEVAVSLLKRYLSPKADCGEMENNNTRGSLE